MTTTAQHLTLSSATLISPLPSQYISRSILTLISNLWLNLPSGSFLQVSPPKLRCTSPLHHVCSCPAISFSDLVTQIVFVVQCKPRWSSICHSIPFPVIPRSSAQISSSDPQCVKFSVYVLPLMWETNFIPIQHSRQMCTEGGHNGKAVFKINKNYYPFNQCSLCWTKVDVYFKPSGIKKGRCQVVTICTTSLTSNSSTCCPHSVFMCIWEQTEIISLYNINWPVFITEI